MGRLDGKVAVITGATSGIGLRTAEIFVAEGAKIVIAGRRAPEGEALAKKLGAACVFRQTDVTVEAQMQALIAEAVEKFGGIDCLFTPATPITAPWIGQTEITLDGAKYDTRLLTTRFARGINVLGFPALSISCGSSPEGLPIGLQMIARPFEENLLLAVGEALERS